MKFLDTNVILRFLTRDHPQQSAAVLPLLEQIAAGTLTVTVSEAVLMETEHVLSSRLLYNLPRADIARHLDLVLSLRGLRTPDKAIYRRAVAIYAAVNVDLADALTVAHMERQGISTVLSFDRDFDRFPAIRREEPSAP